MPYHILSYHTMLSFWFFDGNVKVVQQVLVGYELFFPFFVVGGFLPDIIKVYNFPCSLGSNLLADFPKFFPEMKQASFENRDFVGTPFFNNGGPPQRTFDITEERYLLYRVLSL